MCSELAQSYKTGLQNCDLSYELQPHRILSFLYLERTHTTPIEGIRGTKLEDKFKEDPSFKNLCSWCWGDGFEVKRAGNLTKDRVCSPRTDITTHDHMSLHFGDPVFSCGLCGHQA